MFQSINLIVFYSFDSSLSRVLIKFHSFSFDSFCSLSSLQHLHCTQDQKNHNSSSFPFHRFINYIPSLSPSIFHSLQSNLCKLYFLVIQINSSYMFLINFILLILALNQKITDFNNKMTTCYPFLLRYLLYLFKNSLQENFHLLYLLKNSALKVMIKKKTLQKILILPY